MGRHRDLGIDLESLASGMRSRMREFYVERSISIDDDHLYLLEGIDLGAFV